MFVIVGVVNSVISLFYYIRVVVFMWIKEEVFGLDIVFGLVMVIIIVIILVVSILFGIYL